jgi:Tat protein translocase TatB subunit
MPTSLGPAEILVVLLVALIVLGPSRLPEAGRQVGRAIAEMRRWSGRLQEEVRSTLDAEADPMPSTPAELPHPDHQPPA